MLLPPALSVRHGPVPHRPSPAPGAARGQRAASRLLASGRLGGGPGRAGAARAASRPGRAASGLGRGARPGGISRRAIRPGQPAEPIMTELEVTAQPPVTGAPVLEARSLTKRFPVHQAHRTARGRRLGRGADGRAAGRPVVHALEDVSIALPRAHVTAVVGESGSGKSTLARVLARLLPPTSGEVLLDGRKLPASGAGRRAYTRQVQLVLQDPFSS